MQIEILYTFNWMTPISMISLSAMLVYKYFSVYEINKEQKAKIKIKWFTIAAIVDLRRIILWSLFFFKYQWYLFVFVPLLLQILFVLIASLNNKESKIEKAVLIWNEAIVGVLWVLSITTLTYSPLLIYNDALKTIIWQVVQLILVLILITEVGIILFKYIKSFIR